MSIKYLIVDDEPIAHDIIKSFAEDMSRLELVGECYNALEAIDFLSRHKVDLIFLDIEMPKLKGLDFVKTLQNPPDIIITTAYQEYALQGYEHNVVDYLLKPYSFERFLKAINKVSDDKPAAVQIQEVSTGVRLPATIFVKGDKKTWQLKLNEICFLEGLGGYVKIYTQKETVITLQSLQHFEQTLPAESFIRVHKSYIIALPHLKFLEGNIIHIAGHQVPVGRTYRLNLLNRIQ